MNTTISNNGLPLLPQAPGSQANGTAAGSNNAATDAPASVPGKDDSVRLTDSARALQDAAKVDGQSAIDAKRVEKIRQAIADGSYQVNPAAIADKMIALDAQIAGPAKPEPHIMSKLLHHELEAALDAVVEDLHRAATELSAALVAEREALVGADAAALDRAGTRKQALMQRLEELDAERVQMLKL